MLIAQQLDFDVTGTLDELLDKNFAAAKGVERLALGLFTDGDIRRNLSGDLASKAVTELITRTPKTCAPDELAADVLRRMTDTPPKVMQIFVLEKDKAIGIVHMHDFLRAGLV